MDLEEEAEDTEALAELERPEESSTDNDGAEEEEVSKLSALLTNVTHMNKPLTGVPPSL